MEGLLAGSSYSGLSPLVFIVVAVLVILAVIYLIRHL